MYILEGNIGVGKSTFLRLVSQHCPDITTVQEPVASWASQDHGKSLLGQFYQNPTRWAYTMETLSMVTRVKDHVSHQVNPDTRRIMERSVYSGHYCFAINGQQNGFFHDIEWFVYSQWVDFLLHKRCNPPRGFIYLRAEPEVCMSRVTKRARSSESALELGYMKQIHDRHDKFLIEKEDVHHTLENIPVLVLDCNQEFENNKLVLDEHINKIKAFLTIR
ncbi:MAG: deoxynucleoside kinase [bacterium]